MKIRSLLLILCVPGMISCKSGLKRENSQSGPGKKEMAELNKYMVQKDRERIQNYIERKGLEMTESPAGLWYQIKSAGNGNYLIENDRIVMEYECSLLDGTYCYSSKESGPKELILGRSEMPTGLDQGLKMLKPGGEALFIIPPFLAYGLTGDGGKIPPRAIIIYNVTIHRQN
jgi:FKBP-type peptidyl-prolyl cis-trans isomerase FkpA